MHTWELTDIEFSKSVNDVDEVDEENNLEDDSRIVVTDKLNEEFPLFEAYEPAVAGNEMTKVDEFSVTAIGSAHGD